MNIASFKDLFSSFGEVLDAYIPNHVGRKFGRKHGSIRFADIQDGWKAIDQLNGKIVRNCKLHVMWVRFQKTMPARGRIGSDLAKRNPVWKWVPKVKNVPNQDLGSLYKQALLSNPNGNELAGQKNVNEDVDKDVHEGLSDNSKTITEPLDNAQCRQIYVGKFTSEVLSCRSFMDDDEEIVSSLCPFNYPLEMELQPHEKNEPRKLSSKDKKSGSKISQSGHNSATPY